MKRLLLLFIGLAWCHSLLAQQKPWQPFPFSQVSYYKSSEDLFFTLSADSTVVTSTGDTINFFNRKLYADEPLCIQPGSTMWNETYTYYYAPFVRDSFRFSLDTTWFNRVDTFDDQWVFNVAEHQRMNLSGTTHQFAWDSIWYDVGLQDSVRRISLFDASWQLISADTMRISKYHGWVKWNNSYQSAAPAAATSIKLDLCGYVDSSLSWGFKPPPVTRYFQYYPGDIIRWHQQWGSLAPPQTEYHRYIRDSVTSVMNTPDSIVVYSWQTKKYYSYDSLISETGNTSTYTFYLGRYRHAAERTTAFMAPDLFLDSMYEISFYNVRLASVNIDCGVDTIMGLNYDGTSVQIEDCNVGQITDTGNSWDFSTIRGWLGSSSIVSVSGGYGGIEQVGYYSPTKGIACGNYFPLGIKQLRDNFDVQVFPNPTSDKINIDFHQPVSGTVSVYDNVGRLQMHQRLEHNDLVELNVSNLASGMYLVRILSDNGVVTSKFVKQ